jgi:hypothetical protein
MTAHLPRRRTSDQHIVDLPTIAPRCWGPDSRDPEERGGLRRFIRCGGNVLPMSHGAKMPSCPCRPTVVRPGGAGAQSQARSVIERDGLVEPSATK